MRGRPILGAAAGLFLGFFVAFDLLLLKVIASDNLLFTVLPLGLMVVGIALGYWAPLGRRRGRT